MIQIFIARSNHSLSPHVSKSTAQGVYLVLLTADNNAGGPEPRDLTSEHIETIIEYERESFQFSPGFCH